MKIKRATLRLSARAQVRRVGGFVTFPAVALVEGVIHASNAETPELVLAEDFVQNIELWNGRPVFLDHPKTKSGRALDGEAGKKYGRALGAVFNPRITNDEELALDVWIREEDMPQQAIEIVERVEAGEPVEVSVGVKVAAKPEVGKYKGKKYYRRWMYIRPDHLALLSEDIPGACSYEMGCGVRDAHGEHDQSTHGHGGGSTPAGLESVKEDFNHVNFYRGAYYFTRSDADSFSSKISEKTVIEKRRRGFVIRNEKTGQLLGPGEGRTDPVWRSAVEEERKMSKITNALQGLWAHLKNLDAAGLSDLEIHGLISAALKKSDSKLMSQVYIEAIYDDKVVVTDMITGSMHSLTYAIAEDKQTVTLGSPVMVKRKVVYEEMSEAERMSAGARHSANDQTMLQAIHDKAVELGAACVGGVGAPAVKSYSAEQATTYAAAVATLPEKMRAAQVHPFQHCMDTVIPAIEEGGASIDDPEAFCAWWKDEHAAAFATELRAACSCGGKMMTKTERIASLLKGERFSEAYKPFLMTLSEAQLTQLTEAEESEEENDEEENDEEESTEESSEEEKQASRKKTPKIVAAPEPRVLSEEEYLKQAPQSIRDLVNRQKTADEARRTEIVTELKDNGVYTEEELKTMALGDLEKVHKMAQKAAPVVDYSLRGPRKQDDPNAIPAPPSLEEKIRTARGLKSA